MRRTDYNQSFAFGGRRHGSFAGKTPAGQPFELIRTLELKIGSDGDTLRLPIHMGPTTIRLKTIYTASP